MEALLAEADVDAIRAEATALLCELIRTDTSNPPGGETPAAELLATYLRRAGVECELVGPDPQRLNLVARIRGRGEGPSLALAGHTDVVPADAGAWSVAPFGGVVTGGWVFGRGALDMKHHTACNAVAVARLARSGFRPNGDLVLIAEADEEDGSERVGMPWLVEHHPAVRTDYALNEGGGDRLALADGRVVYTLGHGEKATMPVRVRTRGVAGHASMPSAGDNALLKLGPVLERLAGYHPRRTLDADGEALLAGLAPGDGDLAARIARAAAQHEALAHMVDPLLGSTIAPTMAHASTARNVIPAQAELVLDCRVLPQTQPADLLAELRAALDGAAVELELLEPPEGGTRSPLDTPLRDVTAAFVAELEPSAELLPMLCTGFTNSHFLREAFGTVAYGFFPLRYTDPAIGAQTIHSADERVRQDDLVVGVRFLETAARAIGAMT